MSLLCKGPTENINDEDDEPEKIISILFCTKQKAKCCFSLLY